MKIAAIKPVKKSVNTIAREVLAGKCGNGTDRKSRLTKAGYDYNKVQTAVNKLVKASQMTQDKIINAVAHEVIAGKWGNGQERIDRLKAAGYDYDKVQARVNKLVNASHLSEDKIINAVAHEVISGKYGNEPDRSEKLKAAGYNPDVIQARVNKLLGV